MNTKKTFFLLLSGLLLAGCGNPTSPTSSGDSKPVVSSSSPTTSSVVSSSSSSKEASTHTITFKADGVVVETLVFKEGDTSVVAPDVPAKDGYDGVWEDYTLGTADLVVDAIYTLRDYRVTSGSFAFADGVLSSTSANALAIAKNLTLTHGSFSVKVTKPTLGTSDTGIVFAMSAPETGEAWESQKGLSYYFFFINVDGNAYLAKILGGAETSWNQLGGVYEVAPYSDGEETELKVDYDGTYIDCFVNGTQYIRYKDDVPLTGTGVGVRTSLSGSAFSSFDVKADSIDATDFYKKWSVANNYWKEDGKGNPISDSSDAILVSREERFAGGTLSVNMSEGKDGLGNQVSGDSGVIFGLDEKYANSQVFWEGGLSYYYAFKTSWGGVYLAKVSNGAWNEIKSFPIPDFASLASSYDFKITWDRKTGEIDFFLGGFERIDYVDPTPLTGTAFGFRAQKSPAVYSNLGIKDTIDAKPQYTLVNYDLKGGAFDETSDGSVTSKNSANIALSKTDALVIGKGYEASIKQTTANDCGIVFGVSDGGLTSFWEDDEGVSYYFLFLNFAGNIILSKVVGKASAENPLYGCTQVWNTLGSVNSLTSLYDSTASYLLKAEFLEGGVIHCYLDGALVLSATDSSPLPGNKVGLRSAAPETIYSGMKTVDAGSGNLVIPTDYQNNHGWVNEDPTGTYTSITSDALAVFNGKTMTTNFDYTIKQSANKGDSGVVFGLSEEDKASLTWEEKSYYFFFINSNGHAILAKTNNWTVLQDVDVSSILREETIGQSVQIVKDGGHISISVNGAALIDVTDIEPLNGSSCGIRLQARHATISDIVLA